MITRKEQHWFLYVFRYRDFGIDIIRLVVIFNDEIMPTYEYKCSACAHAWEEVQKINDKKIEKCPECEEKTAQRLISGGSFILKGTGWFKSGGY